MTDGLKHLLFDGDSRIAEVLVGFLAFAIGVAYVFDGPPIGPSSHVLWSGVAMLIYGALQSLGGVIGNLRLRMFASATGYVATFINMYRGFESSSLLTLIVFGSFALICWLFWGRLYMVKNGAIREGNAQKWMGQENSGVSPLAVRREYFRYCSSGGYSHGFSRRTHPETPPLKPIARMSAHALQRQSS